MCKHKMVRLAISGWALALVVSVVPVVGTVSGEPVTGPAPMSEQTNPGGGGCSDCGAQET
ncbi:MAG: hypothetical protein AAGF95_27710 [Chloroflexota bacterium]